MAEPAVLCIHGYGVRGASWRWLRASLEQQGATAVTPDLGMANVSAILEGVRRHVTELADTHGAPIGLVGHSLGAAILSMLTQERLPRSVKSAVLIAPPFGEQPDPPGKLMGYLLQKQLIPQFLIRPRFFSRKTPRANQREIFDNAVPESDELRDTIFAHSWFHNEKLTAPATIPTLVVSSDADRVVPADQSKELAARIGAETWISPASDRVGHDDYLAAPDIVDRLAHRIVAFINDHA